MKFPLVFRAVFCLCLRTRFMGLLILFSAFIHYFGLLISRQTTLSFQGVVTEVGSRQAMFLSLYLSVFTIFFILVAFALWLVPYFHRGERAVLTFVWPVSKWVFPQAYSLQLLLFVLLEWAILLITFGFFYGWEELVSPRFSWLALAQCFLLITVSTQALLFLISSCALLWGPLTTLFLSAAGFVGLQVLASLDRMGLLTTLAEQGSFVAKVLFFVNRLCPPLGSLVFDLRDAFSKGSFPFLHIALWIVWALVGVIFLKVVISRSHSHTISEG